MKLLTSLIVAVGLLAASASTASAVTYATAVDYAPGTGITDANRKVESNALGDANGNFLSLGIGGLAVFSFGTPFSAPGSVLEVTYGDRTDHVETAKVYGGLTYDPVTNDITSFVFLGNLINTSSSSILSFLGVYNFLAILDTSVGGSGRDGFDIDAISVTAVPVPAGVALLGTGIAALGFMGRRRKKALAAA
jgi:hypothetical protein